jgi:hypothetical protein
LKKKGTREFATFIAWQSMIWRCTNMARKDYPSYGGRGIKVCDRWSSYECFLEDMGLKPDGMSLDRIDNEDGYDPGNCRWATAKQQSRNKRSNTVITAYGMTMTLVEWSEKVGIPRDTLSLRVKAWGPEAAMVMPYRPLKKREGHRIVDKWVDTGAARVKAYHVEEA